MAQGWWLAWDYSLGMALILLAVGGLTPRAARAQLGWGGGLALLAGASGGARLLPLLGGWLGGGEWGLVVPPSLQGLLLGMGVALALWASAMRRPGWALADALISPLCLGVALFWLLMGQLGFLYGVPLPATSWAWLAPDGQGLLLPRWPLPLVGGALFALLALIGHGLRRWPWPAGVRTLLLLWLLNLLLFGLGFVRDDPTLLLGPLRAEQVGALLWLGGSAMVLPWRWRAANKKGAAASPQPL